MEGAVSKFKTVEHEMCACGKRSFGNERAADRALGRARAKRTRKADATGTRRGMYVENRVYSCPHGGLHTTSESRRSFNTYAGVTA